MKEFEIAQKIGKPLTDAQFREAAAKALGVKPEKVGHVEVTRRSIDARQDILYRYRVQAYRDNEPYEPYRVAPYLAVHQARPVIVVGAGPAGMFAALKLLQLGLKPIVLELGFLRKACWTRIPIIVTGKAVLVLSAMESCTRALPSGAISGRCCISWWPSARTRTF